VRIFTTSWKTGFLDYALTPGDVRIAVRAVQVLQPIRETYVQYSRSLGVLINYAREIGVADTLRKAWSRLREDESRNLKYAICGIGNVVDSLSPHFQVGQEVAFIAPCHPKCAERLCLPDRLLRPLRRITARSKLEEIALYGTGSPHSFASDWSRFVGWTADSGRVLDTASVQEFLDEVDEYFAGNVGEPEIRLPVEGAPVMETAGSKVVGSGGKLSATCVGYGQYAKITLLGNVPPQIAVKRVHEIDPTQLGPFSRFSFQVDSLGRLRDDDRPDVCFITGFHHTHADIAVEVIERGGIAVVEKPVATTMEQYGRLREVLSTHPGKLFACFQRRYARYNEFMRKDLGVGRQEPISMFATVFEVQVPKLHWYHWPNSRSQIVSNGCHWIDHFLYLNDYAPPVALNAFKLNERTVNAYIQLENGASFTLTLSDLGSSRIGVRDYCEYRSEGRTVSIRDASFYQSESGSQVLRKTRFPKLAVYRHMYQEICRRILSGQGGDSLKSFSVSTETILALDNMIGVRSMPERATVIR